MINLHKVDSFKEKEKLHIQLDIILDKLFVLQSEIKKELEYDDVRKDIAVHYQKLLVEDYQKKCNELTLALTGQYLFKKHDQSLKQKSETTLIL